MSADSMATSVLAPTAASTSAWVGAGASFTPFPVIATVRPRAWTSLIFAAFWSGKTSANTSSRSSSRHPAGDADPRAGHRGGCPRRGAREPRARRRPRVATLARELLGARRQTIQADLIETAGRISRELGYLGHWPCVRLPVASFEHLALTVSGILLAGA